MVKEIEQVTRRRYFREHQSFYKLRTEFFSPAKEKRTLPWPEDVKLGRFPGVTGQRNGVAVRKARSRLPYIPRQLNSDNVNKSLLAQVRIVSWSLAQEAYNRNMARIIYEPVDVSELHAPSPQEQWASDRFDPDNWAIIPEFGVLPKDVDFKGFGGSILFPASSNRTMADAMRRMLRAARERVRMTLPSRRAMIEQMLEVMEKGDVPRSTEHRVAFFCFCLERSILRALGAADTDTCLEHFSNAVIEFNSLITDDHGTVAETIKRHEKEQGGGFLSGEIRKANLQVRNEAMMRYAKELGYPDKVHGVFKAVGAKFSLSEDHISKTLKDMSSEENP